jgi:hypothetical protein
MCIGSLVRAGAALATVLAAGVLAQSARAETVCGEVVTLATRGGVSLSYSIAGPATPAHAALVLLAGGGGYLNLDARGCARLLTNNALVRQREVFHKAGFITALVDAPTNYRGTDGLGGYRLATQHAEDLGKVIADVRTRSGTPVWLVGNSRGSISAVNAAARLSGPAAPDGLVLTSPVTSGRVGGQKAWVAQTVFGVRLDAIRVPVLVVAHANDTCLRSPPRLAAGLADKTGSTRRQTVTVTGGADRRGGEPSVEACDAKLAHGFAGQEAEVGEGIARFVRGARY